MNAKIPVSKLAELTATASGTTSAQALQFIKDLFAIIEDELSAGESVNIEGLGTFTKSGLPGQPIAYTPDPDFAQELNEEFSVFSPVELHDEVTTEMLESVETPEETDSPQPESQLEEKLPDSELPPELPADLTEDHQNTEGQIKCENPTADEANPKTATPATLLDVKVETKPTVEENIIVEKLEPAPEQILVEIPGNTIKDDVSSTAEVKEKPEPAKFIPEDEEEYVVVRRQKSRFGLGFILGLLLGFALGIIAFLAYLISELNIPLENIVTY